MDFLTQNAFNIITAIATSIAFIGGVMMWWGGFKQKQKYNDTALVNILDRLVVLESGDRCNAMHARCEDERGAEALEIARQIKSLKDDRRSDAVLIANHINSIKDGADANFKLLFKTQEEIKIFMGRVDEKLKFYDRAL